MGRQLKFKIMPLVSVLVLMAAFLCAPPVDADYGKTTALIEPGSRDAAYVCSGLSRRALTMAAAPAGEVYGRMKAAAAGGFFSGLPSRRLGIEAGVASGLTAVPIAKIPRNIMFCVHTL
jgi:hypothetical protein